MYGSDHLHHPSPGKPEYPSDPSFLPEKHTGSAHKRSLVRFRLIPLCTPSSVNSVHACWFCFGGRLFCIGVCWFCIKRLLVLFKLVCFVFSLFLKISSLFCIDLFFTLSFCELGNLPVYRKGCNYMKPGINNIRKNGIVRNCKINLGNKKFFFE